MKTEELILLGVLCLVLTGIFCVLYAVTLLSGFAILIGLTSAVGIAELAIALRRQA